MTPQVVYGEYVEHPDLPTGKVWVTLRGVRMYLSTDNWHREFRNRRECVRWLLENYPDALTYAFDGGVTLCGGSIRAMADRAGIKAEPALFGGAS